MLYNVHLMTVHKYSILYGSGPIFEPSMPGSRARAGRRADKRKLEQQELVEEQREFIILQQKIAKIEEQQVD